jgi:hypothetical protein
MYSGSLINFLVFVSFVPPRSLPASSRKHRLRSSDRQAGGKIAALKVGLSVTVAGNPFRIAWVAAEPDLASVGM